MLTDVQKRVNAYHSCSDQLLQSMERVKQDQLSRVTAAYNAARLDWQIIQCAKALRVAGLSLGDTVEYRGKRFQLTGFTDEGTPVAHRVRQDGVLGRERLICYDWILQEIIITANQL